MRPNALRLASILALLCGAASASAQDSPVPGWEEADGPGRHGDPLAVDRDDRLDRVAPTRPEEEVERRVPVQRGDVLSAIAGVRETSHQVEVRLEDGLARVQVEMRFVSSARYAAEVEYRLAVPEGASVTSLEVENGAGRRVGIAEVGGGLLSAYDDAIRSSGGSLPVAHAAPTSDARGAAILVRAAPVRRPGNGRRGADSPPGDGSLIVRVGYVFAAPLRGGAVRFAVPARGLDSRAAAAEIRVRSDALSGATVDASDAIEAAVLRPPQRAYEIAARMSRGSPALEARVATTRCADGALCSRVRVVAGARTEPPDELIVLLDASPSTSGPARGRILPTLGALLSSMPSRTRVRLVAFAARARAIVESPVSPTDVSLATVQTALEADLGSATRFEAAWERIAPWLEEPGTHAIVLIGDGGLTAGADLESFREAGRRAAPLASMNVADRASTRHLREAMERAGGLLVEAGPEAARAAAGHGRTPLLEQISRIFAPVVRERVRLRVGRRTLDLGALRAGEEIAWEGPGRARLMGLSASAIEGDERALGLGDRVARRGGAAPLRLAALAEESNVATAECRVRGPFTSASAPVPSGVFLAPAAVRRCDARPSELDPQAPLALESRGRIRQQSEPATLPMRSLRELLRQRLVPVARGCFRDDRRGRAQIQRRAVYRFTLADREVVSAEVTGAIEDRLRRCLVRAVDDLEIPRFEGTLHVSYPLYTRAQLPPPTLSLDADVAEAVDAVLPPD